MVDGTLLISALLPEDSGNYSCTATNGLLTPPTASAELTVERMSVFDCVHVHNKNVCVYVFNHRTYVHLELFIILKSECSFIQSASTFL